MPRSGCAFQGPDQGPSAPATCDADNPAHRGTLINQSDHTIVATYGAECRGLVQYYLLAGDVFRLHRLEWVMKTSMLKTLTGKHRSSVSKIAAGYKVKIDTRTGHAPASRPASIVRAGNHWSHGSVAFP